jgi:hypothetical protein
MPDDTRPHDDPDETLTQWVPTVPAPAEPGAEPAAGSPPEPAVGGAEQEGEPPGWFSPPTSPPDPAPEPEAEPRWADWSDPWQPSDEAIDEPFDQAAEPAPLPGIDPPPNPEPRAPHEYVSPYPTATQRPTGTEPTAAHQPPVGDQATAAEQPRSPSGVTNANASWANLHQLRILAQVACPILLLVGLTFTEDHAQRGWQAYTAWACFAMVCALLQLAPLVGHSFGITAENAWFLAAVGTAGLVGYWVIIVLPDVSTNTAFAQTLAAGLAVIGLWLSPGRRV